jgi:uncharacterized membrane protein (UPF0127 family)
MKKFELKLDEDLILDVEIADDKESRSLGLSKRTDISEAAMLFVFPYPSKHRMWMKDTTAPLDIIFMDAKGEILEILNGSPGDSKLLGSHENVKFVLELPDNFASWHDIEVGDTLPIPEEFLTADDESDGPAAQMLDDDGNPQMEIFGGERVFSRKKTKELIKKALDADSDSDYKSLGKLIASEIQAQDKRGPEYVDPEKTKYQYAEDGARVEFQKADEEEKEEEVAEIVKQGDLPEKKETIVINSKEVDLNRVKALLNELATLLTH